MLRNTSFKIACDVNNSFYGKMGAAHVYAHQKGSNIQMINQLNNGIKHFSKLINRLYGIDIQKITDSGAAAGVGGGLIAMLNATLKPGIELILNLIEFNKK